MAMLCDFKIRCYTSAISASGIFNRTSDQVCQKFRCSRLPGLTVVELSKIDDLKVAGFQIEATP